MRGRLATCECQECTTCIKRFNANTRPLDPETLAIAMNLWRADQLKATR